MRLAKRNKHTLPILQKHQAVQDTFLPLLTPPNGEELVVHTELVRIIGHVLERLQTEQVEGNTKRGSVLDLDETHGTLLEDLSADPSVLLLDFKVYATLKMLLKIAEMVVAESYGAGRSEYLSNVCVTTFEEETS